MREREHVFVDSGAWIALAIQRDPLNGRAVAAWETLNSASARLFTSVPVVIETFTFLERNTRRDVALKWQESLDDLRGLKILECGLTELKSAWAFFRRNDLPKLSAVDATSFVLMKKHGIRRAFAFDSHFVTAGFELGW